MAERPPLNWEASATRTNATVSDAVPAEVVACLRNARFLHLATCSPDAEPHISLMSHTYLPTTPFAPGPTIIMTTNPASRKTAHLQANPRVSLLVHDWVSPRDDRSAAKPTSANRNISPPGGPAEQPEDARRRPSSSLASMLLGFNRAALGRISATVAGTARVLPQGGAEERWCRARHVENHGFGDSALVEDAAVDDDGGAAQDHRGSPGEGFLEGEDVRVVVVQVREGRIADWKGGVTDFVIRGMDGEAEKVASAPDAGGQTTTNGTA